MAGVFDRETLLDLVVNVIPLVIILFFVVAFALVDPFGGDRLGRILQFGLLVVPFLALAVLTYVSGKVIAADERRAEVYHQGQATMDEAVPRHGDESTENRAMNDATEPSPVEADAAAEDGSAETSDDTDGPATQTAREDPGESTETHDSGTEPDDAVETGDPPADEASGDTDEGATADT